MAVLGGGCHCTLDDCMLTGVKWVRRERIWRYGEPITNYTRCISLPPSIAAGPRQTETFVRLRNTPRCLRERERERERELSLIHI